MMLAAVGLGSFWSVTVAGQDLARDIQLRAGVPEAEREIQLEERSSPNGKKRSRTA